MTERVAFEEALLKRDSQGTTSLDEDSKRTTRLILRRSPAYEWGLGQRPISAVRKFLSESLTKTAGVENGLQEADLILTRLLNVPRAFVLGHPEKLLTDACLESLHEILRRRAGGEPLQYILGEAPFWDMTLEVGEGALVPRPETELLVELALEFLPSAPCCFLDWGTGTGCIAIALLRERPCAKALLAEKNPLSLNWAWKNLKRERLHHRALLWHSREPGDIPAEKNSLSLLVSNPPYIPTGDMAGLMREVRDYEPHLALDGGEEGLDYYKTLFAYAPSLLKKEQKGKKDGGVLAVEIGGAAQAEKLRALAPSTLRLVREISDYSGIPRCMAWVRQSVCEVL